MSRKTFLPQRLALAGALIACFGASGCSWLSAVLAETPTLAPVDAVPRAQVIARVGDTIQLSAGTGQAQANGPIALPQVLAQPSRHVAEKAAPAPDPKVAAAALAAATAATGPFEGSAESDLLRRLESWRQSWESGRFESYSRFYDGAFRGAASSRAAWESARKERLGAARISVKFSDLRTTAVGPDEVRVEFVQQYASAKHRDTGHKTVTLRRDAARGWVIVEESWRSRA